MMLSAGDGGFMDVAKGRVLQPRNRVFHTRPMPEEMYKVTLDRVLPNCGELDPPVQPSDADSHQNIGQCLGWLLLWPKALIRLDPPILITTSQPTPDNDGSQPPNDNRDFSPARSEKEDRLDDFLNEFDDGLGGQGDSPDDAQPHRDLPKKSHCTKRLFSSQEAPEAAPLFPQPALHGVLVKEPKKGRKRYTKKRPFDSSSQPVPGTKSSANPRQRVQDRVPIYGWHNIHELAKPILPPSYRELLDGCMLSLHDAVLHVEEELIKDRYPTCPVYTARVPEDFGFLTGKWEGLIHVRFNDIFNMYHMRELSPSIVRLVALSMQYQIYVERTPDVFIIDPCWMQQQFVNNPRGKIRVTKFIEDCFVNNPAKKIFLLPYFPE